MRKVLAEAATVSKPSAKRIAAKVGAQPPTVSNLLKIRERLARAVVERWVDDCGKLEGHVSVDAMRKFATAFFGAPQPVQMAEYERLAERAQLAKGHMRDKHSVSRRRIPKGPLTP